MCLFDRGIILGWLFLKNRRLRRFFLLPPKTPLYWLKEFRKRACSCNRAISRHICKEHGLGTVEETLQGLEIRVHRVSLFLQDPTSTCFSISMWTPSFCSEGPNCYSQHSLFVFNWERYLKWGFWPFWRAT